MTEPEVGSLTLRLVAVIVLVAANAFFVAAEFALVAARRMRIEALVRRGDRKAKTVQKALQDLYRQLSAAQLGITLASILLGYVAEDTVARLLTGVFEFSEKTARDVMTPRTEIIALPVQLTFEEAADQVALAGRSRYPVFRDSLDDIVGTVHAKDLLAGVRSGTGDTLETIL